jgi:hypothetical protein
MNGDLSMEFIGTFNGNYIKALFRLRNLTFQALGEVRYTQFIGFKDQDDEIQSGD